jgi:hypothetical protein
MTSATRLDTLPQLRHLSLSWPAIAASFVVALVAGCGGSGTPTPTMTGNTSVTLLASSTANDQLQAFDIEFSNLTLTSQSGKAVTLISTPLNSEFMHLNGTAEPLLTVSIPQDVYIGATATIPEAEFACAGQDSSANELWTNTFQGAPGSVTANLAAPITITGTAMGLSLDLQVSQSASSAVCNPNGGSEAFTVTPVFDVTPVTIAAQPTNSTNGKATGLEGLISSVDASGTGFSVARADDPGLNGPSWQVSSNGSTVFQGVSGASQLVAGMPVEIDAAIQADGSLLATRVAVYDTDTATLSISSGPLEETVASQPTGVALGVEQQGYLPEGIGSSSFNFSDAVFQTSSQLANLQNLPFSASFNAANMVPGQHIYFTANGTGYSGAFPGYFPVSTMTLLPQTINGTVGAVSTSGNFTTYTVALAAYDLFPNLAVQPGQANLLTNPGSVVVYADTSTQMLNVDPPAIGSLLRFNGLIFNDSGTLRMDCAQINDGVAELY